MTRILSIFKQLKRVGFAILVLGVASQIYAQDSLNVTRLSEMRWRGWGVALDVEGNHAYVALLDGGVQILDISDPTLPVETGIGYTWGYGYDIDVSGNYAYVAEGYENEQGGVRIFNVSNPTEPLEVGFYDVGSLVTNVTVFGDYAYVGDVGVRIVDISDPSAPVEVGTFDPPNFGAGKVRIRYPYAFVIGGGGGRGFTILDVSDPTNPEEIGSCPPPPDARDVVIDSDYAYVACFDSGLYVIDISDLSAPFIVGSYNTLGNTLRVAVHESYAFVACDAQGLRVIDVSNPSAPVEVDSIYDEGGIRAVTFVGDTMFATGGFTGFRVLDATNTRFPVEIGFYEVPHNALCVVADSQYAYVGDEGRLRIIDLEDSSSPRLIGSCISSPGTPYDIVVQGTYAYAAGGRMMIFDVSDPMAPVLASEVLSPGASGIAVSGQLAYIADFSGLRVFDIADAENPIQIGGWSNHGNNNDVVVREHIAYVACGHEGLRILDIFNPESPLEIGNLDTPDDALRVALSGNYAFVADNHGGLQIINVEDPTLPSAVGEYDGCGYVIDVSCDGNKAFVLDEDCGLQVVDISDPALPMEVGFYTTPGFPTGLTVSGNLAIAANGNVFGIYDMSEALAVQFRPQIYVPERLILLPPYPNPFNSEVIIPLTISRASPVHVTIHNVLGQTVFEFPLQQLPPGINTLRWAGVDFDQSIVASGSYFVRASTDLQTVTEKILFQR